MRALIKGIIVLLCLLGTGFAAPLLVTQTDPTTLSLNPIADAYVDNYYPSQNFGTGAYLETYRSAYPEEYQYIWLKFDISSIPSGIALTNAELRMKCVEEWTGSGAVIVDLYDSTVDSWTESSITWNNMPSRVKTGEQAGIILPGDISWVCRGPVEKELGSNKIITFMLAISGVNPAYAKFSSREGTSTPTLYVEYFLNYVLTIRVQDQVGHPLSASVYFDSELTTTNPTTGEVSKAYDVSKSVVVKASIQVGARSFEASKTILVDGTKTETITITRRFRIQFAFDYADGTKPTGTLSLSGKETLTMLITNGEGEAYLLDGTYKLFFIASPQIDLGSITVDNDGLVESIIDPETSTSTLEQTVTTTPITTPTETPFYLIPGPYIYILLGVLVILGIVAVVVRRRSKK